MRRHLCLLLAVMMTLALPAAAGAQNHHLTVIFKSSTLPPNAAAVVKAAGARVISAVPEIGMMKVEGSASLIATLGALPSVQAVGPTMTFKLPAESRVEAMLPAAFDTSGAALYTQFQWDIKKVTNDGESFNLWPGRHATVVAVVDTGINAQHEALMGNLLGGRNFVPDDPYDPGSAVDPNAFEDLHGHGSHCAGAVAGNGPILGVGPRLALRAYRVLTADGWGATDWIVGGMVAAANDRVDVISMSIGGYDGIAGYTWTDPDTGAVYKMKDVADFIAWKRAAQYVASKGVVLVVAAGNQATNVAKPAAITDMLNAWLGPDGYYFWGASREVPGTLPGVLTISATGPADRPASYTNYGSGAIDVSGPGGDFQRYPSVDPTPWWWDMCLSADMGDPDAYIWMAGTSMATPKVAAVAALIIDQAKARGQRLTPAQVVTRVQQSAVDYGKPGYDMFYGYGMVNAVSALTWK